MKRGLCERVTACDPETSKQITKTVEDAIALVSKVFRVELIDLIALSYSKPCVSIIILSTTIGMRWGRIMYWPRIV